jgi:beta-glucosidase
MARAKYQPVSQGSSVALDSVSPSTEERLNLISKHGNDQNWHSLDDIDASDLSDDEEAGGTMPSLLKKNLLERDDNFFSKLRRAATVVKVFIIRNRLCLIATAGIIFIFLPLLAYQRSIRGFFWGKTSYVSARILSFMRMLCADGRDRNHPLGTRPPVVVRRRPGHTVTKRPR